MFERGGGGGRKAYFSCSSPLEIHDLTHRQSHDAGLRGSIVTSSKCQPMGKKELKNEKEEIEAENEIKDMATYHIITLYRQFYVEDQ